MIKPTTTSHARAAQAFGHAHVHAQPLCVALRLWGFEESEVQSWVRDLPRLGGGITWKIAHDRHARGAGLVVHLVKPSTHKGVDFCWNCAGANYALAKPLAACGVEMVLFSGTIDHLPPTRSGHWATSGGLSPQAALRRLGYLVAATATRDSRGTVSVRSDLIAMIAGQLDAA